MQVATKWLFGSDWACLSAFIILRRTTYCFTNVNNNNGVGVINCLQYGSYQFEETGSP